MQTLSRLRSRTFGADGRLRPVWTSALFTALIIGVAAAGHHWVRAEMKEQVIKEGRINATNLAAVGARSLMTYNYVALEQDAERIARDADVLYAIVVDREGLVAAYSGHDELQGTRLTDAVSVRAAAGTEPLVQHVDGSGSHPVPHYDIAVPVILEGTGQRWGTVRVGVSQHGLASQLRRVRVAIIVAAVVAIAIVIVAVTLVHRRRRRSIAERSTRDEVLRELLESARSDSRTQVLRNALRGLDVLRVHRAELWALDNAGILFQCQMRFGAVVVDDDTSSRPMQRRGPLAEAIAGGVTGGVEDLAPHPLDREAQEELRSRGLVLVAPVRAHGILAAFVALGAKRSGGRFDGEEAAFLSNVAAQLARALERSREEGAQLGRYRVERRLGVGGMAEVSLAWELCDDGLARKVALKQPLPVMQQDPRAVERFVDEARLAASLHHPNIVEVYEVGEIDGAHFIAMEYVDGPSIRALQTLQQGDAEVMPLPIATSIIGGVLQALAYAHRRTSDDGTLLHIVHRDVTARNVHVDLRGRAKLLDFGIARAATNLHLTTTGGVKGTIPYMSPEQAAGRPVDARSDLYSVSVLYYEMLAGVRPFPDGPCHERPPALPRTRDGVPAALDDVLARGFAFDPADRFASAEALWEAIGSAIRPVEPAPVEAVARWLGEVLERSGSKPVSVRPESLTDETLETELMRSG